MTEKRKIDNTIHKLKSLLQVLSSFVACLENDVRNKRTTMKQDEVMEYCSVIIDSLHEAQSLIEAVKNDATETSLLLSD